MLDIFEVIKNRRSIRKYKKKRVEKEKLLKVLEAARLAPSAMNRQPYSFFVTSDVDTIEKISSECNQQWETPTIIIAVAHPEIAVITGGIVKLPLNPDFSIGGIPLEHGKTFACMAETLLLGMNKSCGNYSYGPITREQVMEIKAVAEKRGFELSEAAKIKSY